jgi:acyl homoserine lactone synthase
MTVECVTLATSHHFPGNPLAEQHRLRYRCVIERQDWQVPSIDAMEYDQYDTPATTYLIWRDGAGIARGVSRLCPTDRPFMLQEVFSHMVTYEAMPGGPRTLEGSRFCIDRRLESSQRRRIAQEIVLAYLEYGLKRQIEQIIGVMYPAYWRSLFTKNGWQPVWIGDACATPDGKKSRAAILPLSAETLAKVRAQTGMYGPILDDGERKVHVLAA